MSKLLTVFGATGNQGGSVINSILGDAELSKEYRIRAVTRDPSKPAGEKLKSRGAEVVMVNIDTNFGSSTTVLILNREICQTRAPLSLLSRVHTLSLA